MRSAAVFLLLSATVLAGGCKKKNLTQSQEANPYKHAIKEKVLPDGLVLEEVDLNNDGRPEIFNYWRERSEADRLLKRKDTDLDSDGKIDVKTWYTDDGKMEMEESDSDFDGQIDMWDHFQDTNGDGKTERVSSEVDTDFDGVPNIFTYYRDGMPIRKERDTNGDGKIDHWEKFDEEGKVVKSGRDTNFDGSVDERD